MNSSNKISICFFMCIVLANCEDLVVNTSHGKISGKVFKTLIKNVEYYGYMGIPYASPPINNLRFMPPQPIDPWDGVLAATKEKQACAQFNNNIKKGQPLGYYGVDDCLYLDIFTPSLNEDKRAVIMFLYNEHFMNSYNKTKDYAPDFFIEEDVVIVTLSHRLSVFGFLSLEDETLWGNAGLKDIVSGLEWIKNNIDKFGGDPSRITLMGSQGGAAAVDLLIHSKAKDLFHAAILQSGSSWTTAHLQENARDRAFELGKLMERISSSGSKLIEELNEIPAADLLARDLHASPKDYFKETQRSVVAFGPIIEKDPGGLILDYPENTQEINIPVLLGFNSREGLEACLHYLIEPRFLSFLKKDFPFLLPLRAKLKFDPNGDGFYEAVKEIKKFYFKKGEIKIKSIPEFVTYMGDAIIAYAVDYMARTYAKISKSSVFYYHFDYYSDLNENKNNLMKLSTVEEGTWGAATGDELCYLFKCPSLKNEYSRHEKSMSEERIMQLKLVKMWTNFAKYGNPTPDDDTLLDGLKWLAYTLDNKEYLHIGKRMEIKQDLYKNKFSFWDNFFEKWQSLAVNKTVTEASNNKDEL